MDSFERLILERMYLQFDNLQLEANSISGDAGKDSLAKVKEHLLEAQRIVRGMLE